MLAGGHRGYTAGILRNKTFTILSDIISIIKIPVFTCGKTGMTNYVLM